jgi:hypothetical protein
MGRGEERALFGEAPLACAECLDDIVTELAKAEKLADLVDGKQLYLYTGGIDGPLMREIGRLRELTFRVVGEGTGTSRDLDTYDSRYEHLVLWDATAQRIAGSYRLGPAGRLISQRGIAGLYTSTLFEFSAELQPQLVHGLELGRSFVAPAYWNSRALNQLWQGIGLYLQRNPQLRYLFGAVICRSRCHESHTNGLPPRIVSISAGLPRPKRGGRLSSRRKSFGLCSRHARDCIRPQAWAS